MNSVYQVIEQEQRLLSDRAAFEEAIDQETDSYYLGEWDGKLNIEPQDILNQEYWAGYTEGLKQYWFKQQNLDTEEFEVF